MAELETQLADLQEANDTLNQQLEGYVGTDGTLQTIDSLLTTAAQYLDTQDAQQAGASLESIAQSVNIEDTSEGFRTLYNLLLETVGPELSETYYEEGNSAYNNEDYETAIENLNRAVFFDATNSEALYQLANAYRLNGDDENAIAAYDRVIELFPDTERARRSQEYKDELSGTADGQ